MWDLGAYGQPRAFIRIDKREKKVHMYSALHLRTLGVVEEYLEDLMSAGLSGLARIFLELVSLSDLLDGREGYGSSILVGCIE